MKPLQFTATIRSQKSTLASMGVIRAIALYSLVGKKVRVTIEELREGGEKP